MGFGILFVALVTVLAIWALIQFVSGLVYGPSWYRDGYSHAVRYGKPLMSHEAFRDGTLFFLVLAYMVERSYNRGVAAGMAVRIG